LDLPQDDAAAHPAIGQAQVMRSLRLSQQAIVEPWRRELFGRLLSWVAMCDPEGLFVLAHDRVFLVEGSKNRDLTIGSARKSVRIVWRSASKIVENASKTRDHVAKTRDPACTGTCRPLRMNWSRI
jgi:hypothetical protein